MACFCVDGRSVLSKPLHLDSLPCKPQSTAHLFAMRRHHCRVRTNQLIFANRSISITSQWWLFQLTTILTDDVGVIMIRHWPRCWYRWFKWYMRSLTYVLSTMVSALLWSINWSSHSRTSLAIAFNVVLSSRPPCDILCEILLCKYFSNSSSILSPINNRKRYNKFLKYI